MNTNLPDQAFQDVALAFIAPFTSYGFRPAEQVSAPASFGDALARFEGPDFQLRVLRERGQLFVEVGVVNQTDDWFDLRKVLEFLGEAGSISLEPDEQGLDLLRIKLEKEYQRIRELFAPDRFGLNRISLREFEKEYARRRFGKYMQ